MARLISYPITLERLLQSQLPPVEYVIKPVLPVGGKLIISAHQGSCKTFYSLNLACAIASGITPYLGELEITKRRVLAVLGEGGESEMKRRLESMATTLGIDKQNLFLAYRTGIDLLTGDGQSSMKTLIKIASPAVLVLDPIGQFWNGNENERESVKSLTRFLDSLIRDYGISIIITHHWKKPSKDSGSGNHMASGSYWWTAWTDGHITLKGNADKLTMSFEKVRTDIKPDEKLELRLKEDNLWLEMIGITGVKVSDKQLDDIFRSFGSSKVKLTDLVEKMRKGQEGPSRNTIEKYIRKSTTYQIDDTEKRCFYVVRKNDNEDSRFKTAT
jgi:RecA-family ATPase